MSDRPLTTGEGNTAWRRIHKLAEYDIPELVAEVRAKIPASEMCEPHHCYAPTLNILADLLAESEAECGRLRERVAEQQRTIEWWAENYERQVGRLREALSALGVDDPDNYTGEVRNLLAGRLREQLDAARQALTSYRHDHDYRSPIAYERCLCRLCVAARAALGVEGPAE